MRQSRSAVQSAEQIVTARLMQTQSGRPRHGDGPARYVDAKENFKGLELGQKNWVPTRALGAPRIDGEKLPATDERADKHQLELRRKNHTLKVVIDRLAGCKT